MDKYFKSVYRIKSQLTEIDQSLEHLSITLKRVEKDSINAINITKAIKHLNVVKHNLQESLNELQPSSNIALNQ